MRTTVSFKTFTTTFLLGFLSLTCTEVISAPYGYKLINHTQRSWDFEDDLITSWMRTDPAVSSFQGVASDQALKKYPINSANDDVIVAVIDSGIDVNHIALKNKIWINEDEIPNNNIDDDGNGYIDDIFGWNFLGNKKGMANIKVHESHTELISGDQKFQVVSMRLASTREYLRLKNKEQRSNKEEILMNELFSDIERKQKRAKKNLKEYRIDKRVFIHSTEILKKAGLESFLIEDIESFNATGPETKMAQESLLNLFSFGLESLEKIQKEIDTNEKILNIHLNLKEDIRWKIVQDNPLDPSERGYGNNDVIGPNPTHGTHVAGIIAASKSAKNKMNGIAPNVKVMALRAIPDGDEFDKDIANAILYAVENGARIINMSFGKYYADNSKVVSLAIKEAQKKNVLLIHAAGNDYHNLDDKHHYPLALIDGKKAMNWLTIGASSFNPDESFVARFSNFGKNSVDFFAPGVEILSTVPKNTYEVHSGTSMAAPVVSGVAAILLGHDPNLSPIQIKELMTSTLDRYDDLIINKPLVGEVLFNQLSIFQGKLNAFRAIEKLYKKRNGIAGN